MIVVSSALSLILLLYWNQWGRVIFIIHERCGSLQVYCEWNRKMIEILYVFYSHFNVVLCTSSLFFSYFEEVFFGLFLHPLVAYALQVYMSQFQLHLVITDHLGKQRFDSTRENLIGPGEIGPVWSRYLCCSDYLCEEGSKCSNTKVGGSTPV